MNHEQPKTIKALSASEAAVHTGQRIRWLPAMQCGKRNGGGRAVSFGSTSQITVDLRSLRKARILGYTGWLV